MLGKHLVLLVRVKEILWVLGFVKRVKAWAWKTLCKGSLALEKLKCTCYLENREGSPRKSIALGVDVGKCWPNHLNLWCCLSNSIFLIIWSLLIFVVLYHLLLIFSLALNTFRSAFLFVKKWYFLYLCFIEKGLSFW